MVKGPHGAVILSDVVCLHIVKKLITMELNTPILVLVYYMCQLSKFCQFCNVEVNGSKEGSLRTRIEDILINVK